MITGYQWEWEVGLKTWKSYILYVGRAWCRYKVFRKHDGENAEVEDVEIKDVFTNTTNGDNQQKKHYQQC